MTDGVYDLSTLSYIITGCLGLTNIILGCCVLRMWAKKERWKMRFIAQTGILESRVAEHKHKETANTRMIAIKSRQSDVRFVQNTKEFKEKDFLSRWVLSTENIIIEDSEEKDDRNEMHGETLLGTNHRGTCIIEGHMCSVRVKRIDVAKLSKTSGHDEGGGERGKGKSPHLRSHAVKRHSSAIHVVVETIRNRHKNQCTLSGDGSRSPPRNSSSTHECVIDLAAVRDIIRCSSCVQLPYFIGCAYDASSASLYILLDPVPDGRPMSHIIWDPPVEQEPNWVQRMRWLMDISEGLEYLHQRGIVHGNLRSTNIVCYTSSRGGSRGGMDRRRDSSVDKKEANKFALTRAKLGDPHHFGKMLSVAEREKKAWHKIARDDHAFLWFAPELIRSVSTYRIYTKRRIRSVLFHRERSRSRLDSKSSPGTRAFRSGTSFASMASIFRASSDSNVDVLSPPTLATKTSSPGPSSSPLQSEMQNSTFVPPERKLTEDMYAFGIIMSEVYTLQSPWDWVRRVDAKASIMRDAARRVDQETAMFSPGVPTPRGSAVGRMFKMTSVFLSKDAYSGQKEDKSRRKKRRDIVRHERHQIEKAVLQARRPDAFYLQASSRATATESDEKNELKRGLSSKVEEDKKNWNCFEYMFVKLMNKCCRQSPNRRARAPLVSNCVTQMIEALTTPQCDHRKRGGHSGREFFHLDKVDALEHLSETGMWRFVCRSFQELPHSNGHDHKYDLVKCAVRERWGKYAISDRNKPRMKAIAISGGKDPGNKVNLMFGGRVRRSSFSFASVGKFRRYMQRKSHTTSPTVSHGTLKRSSSIKALSAPSASP